MLYVKNRGRPMVLSKATKQALRGLIYIAAQQRGEPVLSREIADYLGVPVQCITKIMRSLAKRGFLEAALNIAKSSLPSGQPASIFRMSDKLS
ncbi:MAG: Rrf2 family transcriptional regulator [Acidithiobacillus sp.]|nr:Rrf2 family transcriptional regulator [Acidithiobacillus sp.]